MPRKQDTQKSSRLERVKLIGRNAFKSLRSRSSSPRDPVSSSSAQEQNLSDSSHVVLPTSSASVSSIRNPYSINAIAVASSLSLMPPATPPRPSNVRSEQESQQRSDQHPPLQPTSTPKSNPYMVDVGRSSPNPQKVKAGGAVVFEGLKTTLRALKESSDAFPPLKAAVGGLLACMDTVELAGQNNEDSAELDQKLKHIISIVERHSDRPSSPWFRRRLNEFIRGLNQQVSDIQNRVEHGLVRRIAEGSKDAGDIARSFRVIAGLIEHFMIDMSLSIKHTADEILSNALFQKLQMAEEAKYNAFINDSTIPRGGCTAKTREKILDDLSTWAQDPKSSQIYWMSGMAGTGKTTIAYSFCERLAKDGMLGASFFCSRSLSACSDIRRIFPTIAYQLAHSCPPVASELLEILKKDLSAPLLQQFQQLILVPVKAGMSESDKILVIVVDALDECTAINAVRDFLMVIHLGVGDLPIKIFITSRPEPVVQKTIEAQLSASSSVLHLHDVECDLVQADIKCYIEAELSQVAADSGLSDQGWPTEAEVNSLVQHADRLFIYAATAIRYIGQTNVDSQVRLKRMINSHSASPSSLKTKVIDDMYKAILQLAYHKLELEEIQAIHLVLGTIINVLNPLTIGGLVTLLHLSDRKVESALKSLHSVVSLPSTQDGHISTFHASFPDFLKDSSRSGPEYYLNSLEYHQTLVAHSFKLMNELLHENICDLDERPAKDTVPHSKIAAHIPDGLAYACIYWVSHLKASSDTKDFLSELDQMLNKHLLHWLECLSLLGQLNAAVDSLQWLAQCVSHDLLMMINDAYRFVKDNFGLISHHPLQIYYSALVWAPIQSVIHQQYKRRMLHLPKLVCGQWETWGACEQILRGHLDIVNSVAFSPNGSHVISGSHDKTVWIWNATTGEAEHILNGHSHWVNSVAFSPDGSHVISGSSDKTVQIWNATTGVVEHILKGHSDSVNSVAVSPDGNHIISGSNDKTVWIWNATTGEAEHIFKGHSDWVNSVAFSPDGSHVISGSHDKTVQIWNVTTGEAEHILSGYSSQVRSVTFSPDGSHVISGLIDNTVWIWNATTGKAEHILNGHSDGVRSVAFSPDGSHVISGSDDNTVRIWNTTTGEAEHILNGHSHWVRSVAFFPDGSHVISGSDDKTVRIWNATTGETEHILNRHSHWVNSVAFSPDGSHVISGSDDNTVRIWNATTGEAEHILKGHSDFVRSVAFSPDGSHVISGSHDKTVRIWNATTGEIEHIFKGHSDWVRSVAFSPNGSHVISGSNDKTVWIWNVTTGEAEHILKGHSDWVRSVAFSPDGSHVISRSDDKTVWIWNATTGEAEESMLMQSSNHTSIVMPLSQDGSWILATDGQPTLAIPPPFHDYSQYAFSAQKFCFGYPSGKVVILDMMD